MDKENIIFKACNDLLNKYNCNLYLIACSNTITNDKIIYTDNYRLKVFINNMLKYKYMFGYNVWEAYREYDKVSSHYFGFIIDRRQWWHPLDKKLFNNNLEYLSHGHFLIEVNEDVCLPELNGIQYIKTEQVDSWIEQNYTLV